VYNGPQQRRSRALVLASRSFAIGCTGSQCDQCEPASSSLGSQAGTCSETAASSEQSKLPPSLSFPGKAASARAQRHGGRASASSKPQPVPPVVELSLEASAEQVGLIAFVAFRDLPFPMVVNARISLATSPSLLTFTNLCMSWKPLGNAT